MSGSSFLSNCAKDFVQIKNWYAGFVSWSWSKFLRSLLVDGDELCGPGGVLFRSLRLDLKNDYDS
jgi:hypothetical protein